MMTLCFILHLIVGYNMFENKKGEFRIRNSKTHNTVAKKKKYKEQTMVNKILLRNSKTEQ